VAPYLAVGDDRAVAADIAVGHGISKTLLGSIRWVLVISLGCPLGARTFKEAGSQAGTAGYEIAL
jgi:hypothetical protein